MGPRLALYKNLTVSILRYEKVKTTEAKAKEIRGQVERVITLAKRGDLAARRAVVAEFPNEPLVVNKLFDEIGQVHRSHVRLHPDRAHRPAPGRRSGDRSDRAHLAFERVRRCGIAQRSNTTAQSLPGSRHSLPPGRSRGSSRRPSPDWRADGGFGSTGPAGPMPESTPAAR